MIILKHNDTIYIAKSCWGMRDHEARRTRKADTENIPMWHPKRKKNRLVAVSGGCRFSDLIRYEDVFPSKLDPKHLVLESYDKMYALASHFGLCDGTRLPRSTVFAEDDRAFVLCSDGAHVEVENLFVNACENETVMALYDMEGVRDPYEFLRKAYRTIEDISLRVMFPVTVVNTKSSKIEIIDR